MSDPTRMEYKKLTEEEKEAIYQIKSAGLTLISIIRATGTSRELSLAVTKAEEAVMWAVKHVTA